MKTTFTINGTHCNACKMILEENLLEIPGTRSATVDFVTGRTEIDHDGPVDWNALRSAVEGGGNYTVLLPEA